MTFQRKITLGQTIYKFIMSDDMIDKINKIYDKKKPDLIVGSRNNKNRLIEKII